MKEFIDYASERLNITDKLLLEKDILLHKILLKFADSELREDYLFKGGTCLMKCYLGYYRFSEDLDFTYRDQNLFEGKSQKEIRRILSLKINQIAKIFKIISKDLNIDFEPLKQDKKYFEYGGNNKFLTLKMWYKSEISGLFQFIKVQVNFVEALFHKFSLKEAKSLFIDLDKREVVFLYPESEELFERPMINCYDIKEILSEKIRAIMTRKGIKARDFVDVYLIEKHFMIKPVTSEILLKIRFMLKYDKYVLNLAEFETKNMILGEEKRLLLKPVGKDYEKFLLDFTDYLEKIYLQLK